VGTTRVTRALSQRSVLGIFSSLLSSQGLTSVLGLVYWATCARFAPPRELGLVAATAAAMAMLPLISMAGTDTLLLAELPSLPRHRVSPVLRRILGIVVASSLGVALLWIGLSRGLGHTLHSVATDWKLAGLFLVGYILTATTNVSNAAAIALGRAWIQVLQNLTASSTKLVLLVLLVLVQSSGGRHLTAALILSTWVLGLGASAILCIPLTFRFASDQVEPQPVGDPPPRLHRLAAQHFGLNVALQAAVLAMPLIAAALLNPTEVAYFATAWLCATAFLGLPYILTLALFASAALEADTLQHKARQTLVLGLAMSLLLVTIVALTSRYVLLVFGATYSSEGSTVLTLLVMAGIPLVVIDHFVAVSRLRRRMTRAVWFIALGTVVQLGAASVGCVNWGVQGLCIAWIVALTLEAALIAPNLLRMLGFGRAGGSMTPQAVPIETRAMEKRQ